MADVRRAMRDDHPLELLALTSSMLAAIDPRSRDPFARSNDEGEDELSVEELVAAFLDIEQPETSALLAVIGELTEDDLLRARIRRELMLRMHAPPGWLTSLGDVEVYRTTETVHVLGDGDNVYLALRWPTGHELVCVVYIDHNLGTIVKDAFVIPEPYSAVVDTYTSLADDPDTEWRDLDPAAARPRVTDAIAIAAMTYPPFESDTWPACRAIVEWAARMLPEGGHGYEFSLWSEDELAALATRFLASPLGAGFATAEDRDRLETILEFGSGYPPCDPMRWSPVAVEIVLADRIPRKIVADVPYLAGFPDLLRAFVTFCHRERGISAALTEETVRAVDEWEPQYLEIIASPRPQGPAALLARMGVLDPDQFDVAELDIDLDNWGRYDDETFAEMMLDTLRTTVGGDDALQVLDARPLPDEEFARDGIPDDVHARVTEVQALCDECCDALLDAEYRTACRRFLAVVARGDPNVFRRKARNETAAAAVCWIVGRANDAFSSYPGGLYVKDLMAYFGLKQGGASQRATTMLRAGGFDQPMYGDLTLGSPRYLVSRRRADIIALRERYQASGGG